MLFPRFVAVVLVFGVFWQSPVLASGDADGDQGAADSAVTMALTDLDGKRYRVEDYRGKWVVLNFWATWCPPCIEEIPELVLFHEERKDSDAVVLGVAMEDVSVSKLREFADEYFVTYPLFLKSPRWRTPFGYITGMPTTIVIDPHGRAVAKAEGGLTKAALDRFIDSRSKKSP